MNVPQYQKADYSFLPTAFGQEQQGFSNFQRGLSTAMDIGDRERKRQQEDEAIAQLKISNEQAERVREAAIVEGAGRILDAMGNPEDEASRDRAYNLSAQLYYPLTAQEKKSGNAHVRIKQQEDEKLDKIVNNIRMERYRTETASGETKVETERLGKMQEPLGAVGVEQKGVVQRLGGPQTLQDIQRDVIAQQMREPQAMPTVSQPMSAAEKYETAQRIGGGIEQTPYVQGDIGTTGRLETIQSQKEQPTYRRQAATDVYGKPVVSKESEAYLKNVPEEPKPESELDKAKAADYRRDGEQALWNSLAKIQKGRNDVLKTLNNVSKQIAVINDKRSDPRKMEEGDTTESLNKELANLREQYDLAGSKLPYFDEQLRVLNKGLNIPEPPPAQAPAGPSDEAAQLSNEIKQRLQDNAPKGWDVEMRYGRPTYVKKGKKPKYNSEKYENDLANEIAGFAKTKGINIPVDKIKSVVSKNGVEQTIDAIIKRSKGQ